MDTGADFANSLRDVARLGRELAESIDRALVLMDAAQVEAAPIHADRSTKPRPSMGKRVARRPLRLPSGLPADSADGAAWMLTAARAAVIVDGYGVAQQRYPKDKPAVQRERVLDLLDDLVRRHAVDMYVVFDGEVGAPERADQDRQATVRFAPPGTHPAETVRAIVQSVPATRAVVVVSDDEAVAHEAWADGANVLSCALLASLAGTT